MTRNPFGWDLPPGVTQRHIDEAAGVGEWERLERMADEHGMLVAALKEVIDHLAMAMNAADANQQASSVIDAYDVALAALKKEGSAP